MKKFAVLVALGAAAVSTPAFAQDAGDADNGGFYVAGVAGYDDVAINDPAGGDDGFVYGVTAGYDIDTGKTILGVEAEVTETEVADIVGGGGLDLYAGLRLGYEADDNDIIYLKAGYSRVDLDAFDNLEGARLGVGVEHNFGTFFARAEFRHSLYNFNDVLGVEGHRNQGIVAIGAKF